MDYSEIKNLLEKYFDGLTSLNEEIALKKYFSNNNIHNDFKKFESVFNFYETESKLINNKDFIFKIKSKNKIWLQLAASLLLIAGLSTFIYFNNFKTENEGLGTYQNPEIAFKETQKALKMLSENVNLGVASVAYINEYQKTKNKIFIEY